MLIKYSNPLCTWYVRMLATFIIDVWMALIFRLLQQLTHFFQRLFKRIMSPIFETVQKEQRVPRKASCNELSPRTFHATHINCLVTMSGWMFLSGSVNGAVQLEPPLTFLAIPGLHLVLSISLLLGPSQSWPDISLSGRMAEMHTPPDCSRKGWIHLISFHVIRVSSSYIYVCVHSADLQTDPPKQWLNCQIQINFRCGRSASQIYMKIMIYYLYL